MRLFNLMRLWNDRPRAAKRNNRFAPGVEGMEDRLVPTAYFWVTNVNDSGVGSLREAITRANNHANDGPNDPDVIEFHMGSGLRFIYPTSPLPPITDPVDLNGTTQGGYFTNNPVIYLGGTLAGSGGVDGLRIETRDCTVRGLVVSRFSGDGIEIIGSGNRIIGNFVGTDYSGTTAQGNGESGVVVRGVNNHVGGSLLSQRNVISGNQANGVEVIGGVGNYVYQNFIGSNRAGTADVPNQGNGVLLDNAYTAHVGWAGYGNNITGNGQSGVVIVGGSDNWVQNNYIGIRADTNASGNGGHGVYVTGGATRSFIGNSLDGGNQIVESGGDGVFVESGTRNRILYNDFLRNAGMPIDIGPNGSNGASNFDAFDADTGANNLQNTPSITNITFNAATGRHTVTWQLNGPANTSGYTLEFFRSTGGSAPAMWRVTTEFRHPVTGAQLRTDGAGFARGSFEVTLPRGQFLSATATDPWGNTSEFSFAVLIP